MTILILNWRDIKHPLSGGAEISLFEHAKYWQKQGAEVIWFSSQFNNGPKKETIDNIQIIRAGSHFTTHIYAFIYYVKKKLGDPDIIIDNFHFIPYFTPLYIKKKIIIALINEVAGNVWFRNIFFLFAVIGYLIEPYFFRLYKNIPFITGSDSTKNELIKLKIPVKQISLIHHGITPEQVPEAVRKEPRPTILFLGRISTDKGIRDVLEAYKLVRERFNDAQLWIAGKEERKGLLSQLLKQTHLPESQIKYFGYVDDKEKFKLLKEAWVLAHASTKEGWGLTVIEAASQGIPTVGYNVEGLRDSIIDGKTGLLCERNSKALANAIMRLISDKQLYTSLSNGAVNWSSRFNWEKSGTESYKVIKGLIY